MGECSKTCGDGERVNTRDVKVTAAHGGADCIGNSTVTESCIVQQCPGKKKLQWVIYNEMLIA